MTVIVPQALPAGKSTPLRLTDHACPCCRTPLKRWALRLYQPPAPVYWCPGCQRPVCLDALAVLPRVPAPPGPAVQGVPHA
jgi:hypothetical protein